MVLETDLKVVTQRPKLYELDLGHERILLIGRFPTRKLSVRGSCVSERVVPLWTWECQDYGSQQVSGRGGFKTRTDAFQDAITWASENAAGIVRPETEV